MKRLPSILVVEDEPSIRQLVGRVLKPHGWHLALAGSVREGFEVLTRGPWDVLISNFELADGHGTTVIHEFKHRYPEGKVIVISAVVKSDDHAKFLTQHRIDVWFSKPFDWDAFEATVTQFCENLPEK